MKLVLQDDVGDELSDLEIYIATDGVILDEQKKAIEVRVLEMVNKAIENGYR